MAKFSHEEMKYIGLFQTVTGAIAVDCVVNDRVAFVVRQGDMGLAIGKGGETIKMVEKSLKKEVDLIEYSEDSVKFIRNAIYPFKAKEIIVESGKARITPADSRSRRALKADRGKLLKRIEVLLKRHHPIDKLEVK